MVKDSKIQENNKSIKAHNRELFAVQRYLNQLDEELKDEK